MQAKVVTIANAPGYRDMDITVEVIENGKPHRIRVSFSAEDSTYLASELLRVQALAWNNHVPLDAQPHEKTRPRWIPEYGSFRNAD